MILTKLNSCIKVLHQVEPDGLAIAFALVQEDSTMENCQHFVDYYSILQVHPECNARTLEVAYRHLAKIYHPDHPETADMERFNAVISAYRFLKNVDKRLNYDIQYALNTGFSFDSSKGSRNEHMAALTDANIHTKLLMYLYKRRREFSRDPGVGLYEILRNLNCPEENFDFHIWYLKKKDFIETTDEGTLAITVVGVDHVISMSQNTVEQRLRITQSDDSDADNWQEPRMSARVA